MGAYFTASSYVVTAGNIVYASDINTPLDAIETATDSLVDDIRTGDGLTSGTDTGEANAYVVALEPAITSYLDGLMVWLKPANTNTGASTININSLGAKEIRRFGLVALSAGDLTSGTYVLLKYDGTYFQIVSVLNNTDVAGAPIAAYSATETYSFPDVVAGTDGMAYRCLSTSVTGTDPTTDDGTIWAMVSYEPRNGIGRKNRVINGNFDVWQRGTSFSATATGRYLADRWYSDMTGSTQAVSRQGFTLGQTDVPGEPEFFIRSVVASSAGAANFALLVQKIEDVRTLAGQNATLSFYAKADASRSIAVEFSQYFGTGGTPSATVSSSVEKVSLTDSWQKFTVNVSVSSVTGKTIGSDNNDSLNLNFWLDAGSDYNDESDTLGQQSGTFDIAQVQLEKGSFATEFEQRSYGEELALCQRYYGLVSLNETGGTGYKAGGFNSTTAFNCASLFPVEMRTSPTITALSSPTYVGCSSLSTASSTASAFVGTVTVTSSDAIYRCFGAIYGCDAEL